MIIKLRIMNNDVYSMMTHKKVGVITGDTTEGHIIIDTTLNPITLPKNKRDKPPNQKRNLKV
jgi:hypothetical protein